MRYLMATNKTVGKKMAHRNIRDTGKVKWFRKLPTKKRK
jgi:hypothetical protein